VNSDDAIKALTNDDVDFLMLDNATGIYWAANSSGQLKLVGTPYVSGYGMGIALSPQDEKLLPEINKALIQYQNSQDYQENYKRFLNLH
jgi:polar amino acid transport system substrate-binding protein